MELTLPLVVVVLIWWGTSAKQQTGGSSDPANASCALKLTHDTGCESFPFHCVPGGCT